MSKKYSDHLNRAIVLLFRSKRFYNKSCSFIPIYNLNTHGSKITEGTHVLPVIKRDDVKRLQRDNYEEHKSPLQSNSIALVFVVSETYFFICCDQCMRQTGGFCRCDRREIIPAMRCKSIPSFRKRCVLKISL